MPPGASLNLWKKQLGTVPDWAWERTDIEALVLADNRLTSVSEKIAALKTLRMLDLGHNQLAQVPAALGDS
jgi:Leucine-rich repeat (LRR) protein